MIRMYEIGVVKSIKQLYYAIFLNVTTLILILETVVCLQTFFKKGALKNVANFTGKHLFWRLLLTNLQATDLQL